MAFLCTEVLAMVVLGVQAKCACRDSAGEQPKGSACPSQGLMHVVLEVDAPVHKASESYKANGFITSNRGVDYIAERCACLSCKSCNCEDSCGSDWFCFAPNAIEADGGKRVLPAWTYVLEMLGVGEVDECTRVKFGIDSLSVLSCVFGRVRVLLA